MRIKYKDCNLNELMKRRQPAIIEGAVSEYDEVSRATLLGRFSDVQYSGALLERGTVKVSQSKALTLATFTGSEILSAKSRAHNYFFSTRFETMPPALTKTLPRPFACDQFFWFRARLWFATQGTRTPLHRDIPHNLILILEGNKDVLLTAPASTKLLKPYSPFSRAPNFAGADLRQDDPPSIRNKTLSVMQANLNAGEILYIPPFWWHDVVSSPDCTSVNYWFAPFGLLALMSFITSNLGNYLWKPVDKTDACDSYS